MSLESALYSYLTGEASVTALVGANIFEGMAPEGSGARRLVYTRIGTTRFDHLTAASGMVRARMQIDYYGNTPDDALSLAEAVRQLLHGYSGSMGTEALAVRWSTIDEERVSFEPPHDASSVGVHRISADYGIVHHETVPTF